MTGLTFRPPAVLGRTAFDLLFDQFFTDPGPMIKRSTDGYPLTDIYESDDGSQIIEMALAGFSKDDLSIEISENKITISYQGKPWGGEDSRPRRIAKRSFSKTFIDYQNQLDLLKAEASFENGLLKIVLPPRKEIKPITIDIK